MGIPSVYKFWKIYLELMDITGSVWTCELAEFALETLFENMVLIFYRDFPHITLVFVIKKIKQRGEYTTVFKTHSTSITDLKNTSDFFL
jgi:hypothetical protein